MKLNRKIILSVVLILLVATSSICLFAGCETINKAKDKVQEVFDDIVAIDENKQEMLSGKVYDMPKHMVFSGIKTTNNANEGISLTATITPANASKSGVKWDLLWDNPNSQWANGKDVTKYVSLVATTGNSLIANVKCLQPFGEKMNIVCSSLTDASLSDTCIVDYKSNIYGATFTYTPKSSHDTSSSNSIYNLINKEVVVFGGRFDEVLNFDLPRSVPANGIVGTADEIYADSNLSIDLILDSAYTINPKDFFIDSIKDTRIYLKIPGNITSAIETLGVYKFNMNIGSSGWAYGYGLTDTYNDGKYVEMGQDSGGGHQVGTPVLRCIYGNITSHIGLSIYNDFKAFLKTQNAPHFYLKYELKDVNGEYIPFEFAYRFSDESLNIVTVTSVNLSQNEIVL